MTSFSPNDVWSQDEILTVAKHCPKCNHVNPLELKYCQQYSFAFDFDTLDDFKKGEKDLKTQVTDMQHELVFIRNILMSQGLGNLLPHGTSEDVLLLAKEYGIPIEQR
ncbi:hypothetical protein [Nitrosopumilus ureiphilus]|uniref:Uncharacterized protein n=1 Tax=Nitrosopumilus ureiphilus TaxID=1470067 RepID=A0A7D5M8G1_9ARCH|nr:hypothetical protein [Nitrosopumilus ureiphilus]QLH05849.1 hypothetical protein C5F50_01200 [Nitrosopumilus ureiphilus]